MIESVQARRVAKGAALKMPGSPSFTRSRRLRTRTSHSAVTFDLMEYFDRVTHPLFVKVLHDEAKLPMPLMAPTNMLLRRRLRVTQLPHSAGQARAFCMAMEARADEPGRVSRLNLYERRTFEAYVQRSLAFDLQTSSARLHAARPV